jgi:AcrR family transcriptional regulator
LVYHFQVNATRSGTVVARPLRREQRRESILAAAARAFAEAGFDGTSMEDLAEASGVTKLILYRHFDSKESLYRAILDRVATRLATEVAASSAHGRNRGVIVPAFLRVARDDPDGFRLLWRQASREPKFASYSEDVRRGAVAFAHELLESRIKDASLLDWAAPTIVAFLVEAVLQWLDFGNRERDERFVGLTTGSLLALLQTWSTG